MAQTHDVMEQMGPVSSARLVLLVFGGMLAGGALLVGTIVYVGGVMYSGAGFDREDPFGIAVFGGLSLVIVWRGLVASARVRRGSTPGESLVWLAKIAPVLLLLGGVGGGAAMISMERDHLRTLHADAQKLCALLDHTGDAMCEKVAIRCATEARNERVSPDGVRIESDDPKQKPDAICVNAHFAH